MIEARIELFYFGFRQKRHSPPMADFRKLLTTKAIHYKLNY